MPYAPYARMRVCAVCPSAVPGTSAANQAKLLDTKSQLMR